MNYYLLLNYYFYFVNYEVNLWLINFFKTEVILNNYFNFNSLEKKLIKK